VVQAVRQALHGLTGQDFGPKAEAGPGEHARAVAAWHDWWRQRPVEKNEHGCGQTACQCFSRQNVSADHLRAIFWQERSW
jgi:hypothetical protein